MKIGLCITGYKGRIFLEDIGKKNISFVRTYNIEAEENRLIKNICDEHDISLFIGRRLGDEIDMVDKVFCIGWQYLIDGNLEKIIVMHDSYLPSLRGFCPTPTALILGHDHIGVTAIQPTEKLDDGPLYSRKQINITYPITLKEAYDRLNVLYVDIFNEVVNGKECVLFDWEVDEISYSVWRDERDMFIDWTKDNYTIKRFIDALSYPCGGAKSTYEGADILITSAECIDDVNFIDRHCGKLWKINGNMADVVCGQGMIRITAKNIKFNRLRSRLGEL